MIKTRGIDLEPIDRLEEKLKLLVNLVERLQSEQARTHEENVRLARELEAMRERMSEVEGSAAEMTLLREERDLIRTRVADMLEQLEGLNL